MRRRRQAVCAEGRWALGSVDAGGYVVGRWSDKTHGTFLRDTFFWSWSLSGKLWRGPAGKVDAPACFGQATPTVLLLPRERSHSRLTIPNPFDVLLLLKTLNLHLDRTENHPSIHSTPWRPPVAKCFHAFQQGPVATATWPCTLHPRQRVPHRAHAGLQLSRATRAYHSIASTPQVAKHRGRGPPLRTKGHREKLAGAGATQEQSKSTDTVESALLPRRELHPWLPTATPAADFMSRRFWRRDLLPAAGPQPRVKSCLFPHLTSHIEPFRVLCLAAACSLARLLASVEARPFVAPTAAPPAVAATHNHQKTSETTTTGPSFTCTTPQLCSLPHLSPPVYSSRLAASLFSSHPRRTYHRHISITTHLIATLSVLIYRRPLAATPHVVRRCTPLPLIEFNHSHGFDLVSPP